MSEKKLDAARKRLEHYVSERRKMLSLDLEHIHGLHSPPDPRAAELLLSDLVTVLAALAAPPAPQPAKVYQLCPDCHRMVNAADHGRWVCMSCDWVGETPWTVVSAALDKMAAAAPAPQPASVDAFVQRCNDIRHGSPNAFYDHVDKFCKAWTAAAPAPVEREMYRCARCQKMRDAADEHPCIGAHSCAPAPVEPPADLVALVQKWQHYRETWDSIGRPSYGEVLARMNDAAAEVLEWTPAALAPPATPKGDER